MWKRVYVWEFPVRLLHWIHVPSMLVLGLTGIYIGHPFVGLAISEQVDLHITDWMRLVHFVAAWVFGLAFLARLYWFFVGNQYARWSSWAPVGRERVRSLGQQIRYYFFLQRERPRYTGANPVATLTYLMLGVLILLQGLTGIALYAEAYHAGGLWRVIYGWMLVLFNNQVLRLVHHFLLFLFGIFTLVHLYMMALGDIEEANAPMTGIISGWKYEPVGDEEEV